MTEAYPTPSAIPQSTKFARHLTLLLVSVFCWFQASAAIAQPPPKSMVKRCNKGDAENCYYAGINQSARNPDESRRYHTMACNGGYRKGCKELHDASLELLDGNAADHAAAVAHFEAACAQSYGRSCTSLATALWNGTGITIDKTRATTLWQKGCDLGSRVGCRRAGTRFEKGDFVAKDLSRALAFFQRSCNLELESACADAGRLLQAGVSPSTIYGTAPSRSKPTGASAAAGPLYKACIDADVGKERGDACWRYGRMLAEGDGVAKDQPLAFEAFRKGCAVNHVGSCLEAGKAAAAGRGLERDTNAALHFFGKACRRKSAEGCQELCRMQCDAGQPFACERTKSKKWPMSQSCAMPH